MRDPPHPNPAPSLAALALPRGEGVSPFTNHESPVTNHQSLMRKLADIERERALSIVGQDEVDPSRGRVSWISPVARALNKARVGSVVSLKTPAGTEELEVTEIHYVQLG